MALLELHHLGPINNCEITIKKCNIITGPQASGKSTIAKSIFFFRTIKQDFYNQLTGKISSDEYRTTLENDLKKRLRSRFIQIFGTSWSMPANMRARYSYSRWVTVQVYLTEDRNHQYPNFIDFEFGEGIYDFFKKYEKYDQIDWTPDSLRSLKIELDELFSDDYETIYIPAGRSLITLLTDQLTQMAASMVDSVHLLDFCTRSYINTIAPNRKKIGAGLNELLRNTIDNTQKKIDTHVLNILWERINNILHARYVYEQGEERLLLDDGHYVKINFASSGQQEAVWVLNLMYLYLLERKKVCLIVEEPEAHLYPDSQQYIAEALGIFASKDNQILVTTHSPYILGSFNNQIFAGNLQQRLANRNLKELKNLLEPATYLFPDTTGAYYVKNGKIKNAYENDFIRNELIDGASDHINQVMDELLELDWRLKENANA